MNGMLFMYLWCILTVCYEISANDHSLTKRPAVARRRFNNPPVKPAFRQQQRNRNNKNFPTTTKHNSSPRLRNASRSRVRTSTTQGKALGGRRTTEPRVFGTFPFTTPNIYDVNGLNYRRYTPKPKWHQRNIISNAFRLNDTFQVRRPPTRVTRTRRPPNSRSTMRPPSRIPDVTPINSNMTTNHDAETIANSSPKVVSAGSLPNNVTRAIEGAMPSTPTHIKMEEGPKPNSSSIKPDSSDSGKPSESKTTNSRGDNPATKPDSPDGISRTTSAGEADSTRTTRQSSSEVVTSSPGKDKEDEQSEEDRKTEEEERRSQENINKFQENLRKAVALNNDQDVPMEMFRCLPNEKGDCDSDSHFRNVSEKLLLTPDNLRVDLDQFQKISARLKEVNLTWPEDFVFDKQAFQAKLDDIDGVVKQVDRNKSDEVKVISQYKLVQDMFKPVQTAARKPGQIFATDVVREIVKIKNLFIKRKALDLLFYVLINPSYKGDKGDEEDEDE